ncbi:hypothetical protein [Bradyrhizobium jicamae]|uniref:hypothetical protein n=1 Tax=Bradyrhizobium jicamae TaxID=280332 RepID=UPI001BA48285|nr:hypothetical protein [Bradyrhizobium jicamae]MBR0936683.1 hypothetical protein [Bradyrhizobium jicamae]
MTDADRSQSTLDQHLAMVGRVVAKFVSTGLAAHNIDTRGVTQFLGTQEDEPTFAAVLTWMLDEDIIRARHVSRTINGPIHLSGAQLTAKGLAIVKQPLANGDTVEKRIQAADGGNSTWANIGDLIGGIAGGLIKSVSSG